MQQLEKVELRYSELSKEFEKKKEVIGLMNDENAKLLSQNENLRKLSRELSQKSEDGGKLACQLEALKKQNKELSERALASEQQKEKLVLQIEEKHTEELRKIHLERQKMLQELESQKDYEFDQICKNYIAEVDKFKRLAENLESQNQLL